MPTIPCFYGRFVFVLLDIYETLGLLGELMGKRFYPTAVEVKTEEASKSDSEELIPVSEDDIHIIDDDDSNN